MGVLRGCVLSGCIEEWWIVPVTRMGDRENRLSIGGVRWVH